jgi:DNA (cytosine-5)-methyltransferase 1
MKGEKSPPLRAVELFAGSGGLALAASMVGVEHAAVVEWNAACCANIRANQAAGSPLVKSWPLVEADVREVDFKQWNGVDLVCGGPPCQPFSLGGRHLGAADVRDMFPQAVRAVREIQPAAFVLENVRGILRPVFSRYVEYIRLQLQYPQIEIRKNETNEAHFSRLQRLHSSNSAEEPVYQLEVVCANAADYGVPQRRERVFFVGFRRDLAISWNFPLATHSRLALDYDKATGCYWDRVDIPQRLRSRLAEPCLELFANDGLKAWRTVREGIAGLGAPSRRGALANHIAQLGARSYPGHSGSPLDLPAKTLKAGGHGVPGGENMLVDDTGQVRYFTVREAARLQTFPDEFTFNSSWTENMRQLGNAVPCELATVAVGSVVRALQAHRLANSDLRKSRSWTR